MNKKLLGILFILSKTNCLFAQDFSVPSKFAEPVGVQSPNAAGLGTFGNISVSQYTGMPNTEIPLYTLQDDGLTVPISLRYNAAGFRPDEHPGWVGMNWSLHAGGVITRVVNRMPDEFAEPSKTPSTSYFTALGYYYTNEILNSPTWQSKAFAEQIASRTITSNYVNQYPYPNNGGYTSLFDDSEPDEFSFVLPGMSGTFYKDSDGSGTLQGRGTWKVRCDQLVKVEVNNPADPLLTVPLTPTYYTPPNYGLAPVGGNYAANFNGQYPKTFAGFTLTTADGTRYVFGHDQGSASPAERPAIEYSTDLFNQRDAPWTANAWYLTKIISPADNQITFTYEREPFKQEGRFISQIYHYIYSELLLEAGTPANSAGGGYPSNWTATSSCTGSSYPNEFTSVKGKLVAPVYLRSISCRTGEIKFARSTSKELRYIPEIAYQRLQPQGAVTIAQTNYPYISLPLPHKNGTVGFAQSIENLQWKELDDIVITQQGQPLKSFHLGYSTDPNQRLTLLSVKEIGQNNISKPPYTFTYYDNNQGLGLATLPNYLMLVSDSWGFYNNTAPPISSTSWWSTTPNFPNFTHVPGSSQGINHEFFPYVKDYDLLRTPNTNPTVYLRGLLTHITYPTGGYSDFEYEQHTYGSRVDTMRISLDPAQTSTLTAGGVRVKKITSATVNNPGPGDKLTTEYLYVSGYAAGVNPAQLPSSGVLTSQPKYRYNGRAFPMYVGGQPATGGYYRESILSSQSVIPACGNTQGSYVGYSQVVEKRSDGSYTKYYFTNFTPNFDSDTNLYLDGSHFDEPPLISLERSGSQGTQAYSQYSSREHERGRLLQTAAYNGRSQCVQRQRTQYTSYENGTDTDYARMVTGRQLNFNLVCTLAYYGLQGTTYKLFTYPFLPSSETTTTYDINGNNGIATTVTYKYKNFQNCTVNLLAEKTTVNSKFSVIKSFYQYPFDYGRRGSSPPASPIADAISLMPGRYMLSSPIEIVQTRDSKIVGAKVFTYTTSGPYIVPYQVLQLTPTQPLNPALYTPAYFDNSQSAIPFITDSHLLPILTFGDYDAKANAGSITKSGGLASVYLWDYSKSLLTAKVENATRAQCAFTSFEADSPTLVNNTTLVAEPYEWVYDPRLNNATHLQRNANGGVSGKGYYILDGGWGIGRDNIPPGDYELTFWAQGGWGNASRNIYVFIKDPADQLISQTDEYTNSQGFHLLHARIRINQGSVATPTGSIGIDAYPLPPNAAPVAVPVDDVRLYPTGSQMTTYTHIPQVGISSLSDANSRPTFYEYDGLGRLLLARDQDGNIVKTYEYNYQH